MKPMFRNPSLWCATAGAALALQLGAPDPAAACGGFFCSQSAPVNQAAERIIFADGDDGTVTAIIQIMYEGPSESFSWLLPISSVPKEGDIGVASDQAFDRLQNATNPQYSLTTRVEGECKVDGFGTTGSASGFTPGGFGGFADAGTAAPSDEGGVTVEASGAVGPFEWAVISFDASLPDPADAATEWLEENGYDVGEGAPGLLRPYLEDGLNLLALRLTKGADSGSIRPISLTYPAELPMIPIKLTAVAANDDMGVMTWLLSSARGVPKNYLSLELNEARINWFNAASNYGDVVTEAANEAGGQGFVTEYADDTDTLADTVWTSFDESQWSSFRSSIYSSFGQMFDESYWRYASFDGYWDAVRASVALPQDVLFEDFQLCPSCYSEDVEFSPSSFADALEEQVIDPLRDVQRLIDRYGYVTRLYSTMSAMDMTVDPVFTFNPDLAPVSNVHTAERIIECSPDIYEWEAPWRIELPQGGVVRGTQDQIGSWPTAFDDQPSNARIKRLSESGNGKVLENNLKAIGSMLDAYNDTVPTVGGVGGGSDAGVDGAVPDGSSSGGSSSGGSSSGGSSSGGSNGDADEPVAMSGGGGCSATPGHARHTALGLLFVGLALLWVRRRRASAADHS